MPTITSTGTYTKDTAGNFDFLARSDRPRLLRFSGSSVACSIQTKDDTGTFAEEDNGSITTLPDSALLVTNAELNLVVTGSPNFNVTCEYVKYV